MPERLNGAAYDIDRLILQTGRDMGEEDLLSREDLKPMTEKPVPTYEELAEWAEAWKDSTTGNVPQESWMCD